MKNKDIMNFFDVVDAELVRHAGPDDTLELYVIGRSALVIGLGSQLQTKDVDVVKVHSPLLDKAEEVFKKDAPEHELHGFYLDVVSSGLPPLPSGFQSRCIEVEGPWRVIRLKRLEVHDLVVSKLKRFHQGDRQDVQIICDTEGIEEHTLRERFDLAYWVKDQDDSEVVKAKANLETVAKYLDGRLTRL
jgi:hypothetical protein